MNIKLNDREINAIAEAISAFEMLNIDSPSSDVPDSADVYTMKTLNGIWSKIMKGVNANG